MEFKIIIPLLPLGRKQFLSGQDGKMDFLGQFLLQLGFNEVQLHGHKLPSDLQLEIQYFTSKHRNRIIDSILTLEILKLDLMERSIQCDRITKLMAKHSHTIQYIHTLSLPQKEVIQDDSDSPF